MTLSESEELELLALRRKRAMASGATSKTTESSGVGSKVWDALAVPAQKSKEGLEMISEGLKPSPEFTGNMVRDVVMNYPSFSADVLSKAAPDFISRGSLVTGGALKAGKALAPAIKAAGRGLAKAAEGISGLEYKTPGVLVEAAKDSSLMFSQGTDKAGKMFEKLSDKGRIRKSFARSTSGKDLLDEALNAADDGSLTPEEALVARRTLDKIKKTLPDYSYRQMRETFDSVAKTKSAEADKAFSRAVKADALRTPFATNKSGGTSIAKGFLGTLAGVLPTAAMSPAIQGSVATLLGVGARGGGRLARTPYQSGSAIGALLELIERNPDALKR